MQKSFVITEVDATGVMRHSLPDMEVIGQLISSKLIKPEDLAHMNLSEVPDAQKDALYKKFADDLSEQQLQQLAEVNPNVVQETIKWMEQQAPRIAVAGRTPSPNPYQGKLDKYSKGRLAHLEFA